MIRIAILDDQPEEMKIIRDYVEKEEDLKNRSFECKTFHDPFDLLEYTEKEGDFDFYLLDVLLPHLNGIEVAKQLRKRSENGEIVFLTNSREYAVDAFGVRASGYLVKPVSQSDFSGLFRRLVEKVLSSGKEPILIRIKGGVRKVRPDEIVMVESFNHHREIRLSDGRKILTSTTLVVLKEMLKKYREFYSPHRAYIVNLDYVTGLSGGELYLTDFSVPIAKNIYREFKEYFMEYSFGK